MSDTEVLEKCSNFNEPKLKAEMSKVDREIWELNKNG